MSKVIYYEWERDGRHYRIRDNARLEIMGDWGEWAYANHAGIFQGYEEALAREMLRLAARGQKLQAENMELMGGDVATAGGEHATQAIKGLEEIAETYEGCVERGEYHVVIIGKHTGEAIGCMTDPSDDALCHAAREDPGCIFRRIEPSECPVCGKEE